MRLAQLSFTLALGESARHRGPAALGGPERSCSECKDSWS